MIGTWKNITAAGGRLAFAQVPAYIRMLFSLIQLDTLAPTFDGMEDALKSFVES